MAYCLGQMGSMSLSITRANTKTKGHIECKWAIISIIPLLPSPYDGARDTLDIQCYDACGSAAPTSPF